jgi:hypothetical protein
MALVAFQGLYLQIILDIGLPAPIALGSSSSASQALPEASIE